VGAVVVALERVVSAVALFAAAVVASMVTKVEAVVAAVIIGLV
jgi:hypothetical protein